MSETAKVSIIIPAYNAEAFLADAIECALNQDYPQFDILVIDDGSTDSTANIAAKFSPQVKVITHTNRGSAATRNVGISETDSPIISFFDADDLFDPKRLSKQVAVLSETNNVKIAFALLKQNIGLEENTAQESGEELVGCCVGAMTVYRSVFDEVGLFDEELKSAYFLKWFMRAKEIKIGYELVRETLITRRIHGDNQGLRNQSVRTAELAKVLKSALDRRRRKE